MAVCRPAFVIAERTRRLLNGGLAAGPRFVELSGLNFQFAHFASLRFVP